MAQEKLYTDKDRLQRLYWEEGKSIKETADACDCAINTIQRWMDTHDIPTRDEAGYAPDDQPKHRDPDWLREQYHGEGLTLDEMAAKTEVTRSALIRNMDKHEIERRAPSRKNGYATFRTNTHGYEMWASWTESHGKKVLGVHRLVAVAHHGVEAVKDMHVTTITNFRGITASATWSYTRKANTGLSTPSG